MWNWVGRKCETDVKLELLSVAEVGGNTEGKNASSGEGKRFFFDLGNKHE